MLRRIAPQNSLVRATARSMDDEELFTSVPTTQTNHRPLYALTIALRVGFLAAILLKAFSIWQW